MKSSSASVRIAAQMIAKKKENCVESASSAGVRRDCVKPPNAATEPTKVPTMPISAKRSLSTLLAFLARRVFGCFER